MALMLLGAAITDRLHCHPILGAFAVGLMVGMWKLSHRVKEKVSDFAFSFFVPVIMATLGLRANLRLINTWQLWAITGIIFVVLSVAKYTGGGLGAKIGGMTWTESAAVGAAANCKGAMGLVAAKVAYDLGIFPGNLYAMLVVVSLVRTLIPIFELQRLRPALLRLEERWRTGRPGREITRRRRSAAAETRKEMALPWRNARPIRAGLPFGFYLTTVVYIYILHSDV